MSKIKIVLDSSADMTEMSGVDFAFAPLKIVTDHKEYVDDSNLDVKAMTDEMAKYKGRSSTSCPNTEDWLTAFGDAENILCITITSGLSGSYNSAVTAKDIYEEEHHGRKVSVIDSLSTGPEMALMAERAKELIDEGKSLDEVTEELKNYETELAFVLCSLRNFANNGRVSKIIATAVGVLGIRLVGRASDIGTLEMLSKVRGQEASLDAVIEQMTERGYSSGRVIISHCFNPQGAARLEEKLKQKFPEAQTEIRPLRGLCSFYAELGGLLIGYRTEPVHADSAPAQGWSDNQTTVVAY